MNDGGLVIAAALVESVRPVPSSAAMESPARFIGSLAAANLGKFAIRGSKNRDYAASSRHLTDSLPYLRADLEVLRPGGVMLPKTMWCDQNVTRVIRDVLSDRVTIIPVPQCNARVINIHLQRHDDAIDLLQQTHAEAPWRSWIEDLPAQMRKHYWRYLVAVRDAAKREPSSTS
jgi:hypothetical protein